MSDQKNLEIPKSKIESIPGQEIPLADSSFSEKKAEKIPSEQGQKEEKNSQDILTDIQGISTQSNTDSQDDINLKKVEDILSQGMENVFLSMDAHTQEVFRIEGEKTAKKINSLMQKAKIKVSELISLIGNWLKIIPRVNKYYLEQEAKIKADAIMKIYHKK